jgi:hypothetical protein
MNYNIEYEREEDSRWIAEVPGAIPGNETVSFRRKLGFYFFERHGDQPSQPMKQV